MGVLKRWDVGDIILVYRGDFRGPDSKRKVPRINCVVPCLFNLCSNMKESNPIHNSKAGANSSWFLLKNTRQQLRNCTALQNFALFVDNGPSRKVSYDWQQALAMHLGRARGEPKALLCHTKIPPFELQIIYFKLVQSNSSNLRCQ